MINAFETKINPEQELAEKHAELDQIYADFIGQLDEDSLEEKSKNILTLFGEYIEGLRKEKQYFSDSDIKYLIHKASTKNIQKKKKGYDGPKIKKERREIFD